MVEEDSHNSEKPTIPVSPRIIEFPSWPIITGLGVFPGMLLGGMSKDVERGLKLWSTADKREQHRFLRIIRGSIFGGVYSGMVTASFYGIMKLLQEKRGVHDVFNIVVAGAATSALPGLMIPGSLHQRAMIMALGSVMGAACSFPLGWIQVKMLDKSNARIQAAHPDLDQREVKSGVSAATERLEGHLRK